MSNVELDHIDDRPEPIGPNRPHAGIPQQGRIIIDLRPQGMRLLIPVHGFPKSVVGKRRGHALV